MRNMKPYSDFTLVFQGPLHKNFIYGLLNNYKEYTDNIVVSHWDTDDAELLAYLTSDLINCKLITNRFHKNYNAYNNQNIYYQTYTTLEGMKVVDTQFVLKLRTDQWFGNLTPMFDRIRQNPDKFVCANLHFRPDHLYQYHPSDKLYGGKTALLQKTLEIMHHRIHNNVLAMMAGAYMYTDDRSIVTEEQLFEDVGIYDYNNPNRPVVTTNQDKPLLGTIKVFPANYIGLVPEVITGTSFLMAKGIYPDPKKSVSIVKENFDIVRVEDMVPYVNKTGNSNIEHNSSEISHIEQYG
jgi:hypothetical protein